GAREGHCANPEGVDRSPRQLDDAPGNRLRRPSEGPRFRLPVSERRMAGRERPNSTGPNPGETLDRGRLLPRQRPGHLRDRRSHRGRPEREPPGVLRLRTAPRDLGRGNQQDRAELGIRPPSRTRSRATARGSTHEAPRRPWEFDREARDLRTRPPGANHPRPGRRNPGILTSPGAGVGYKNSERSSSGSSTPKGWRTGEPFFRAGSKSSYVGTFSVR